MRRLLLVAALLLTACPPSKPDDSGATADVDADGDGYTSLEDCDDEDPEVFPGALELCNGVDDDCDGYADADDPSVDDALEYVPDDDGDGFGAIDGAIERACEDPGEGWAPATRATDCDDGDPAVHPETQEVCNEIDDDCDGEIDEAGALDSSWYLDVDGDGYGNDEEVIEQCEQPSGYVLEGGDCHDGEPTIFPGADELCNGEDDDCDGEVDEDGAIDAPTWYADTDGDGYGGTDSTTSACEQPSGFLAAGDDCDDGDTAVFPGADELCNGEDDDCDGTIDEDDATDAATWYEDADGDGFGDPDSTTAACSQPTGYTTDATDCNDTSDVSWPGADELCDGLDNDCDGTVDEDVVDGATWYLDADGDGYGDATSTSTTAACEQPTGYVGDATDCDDSDAAINPWADELCNGVDDDCDGSVDEGDATDADTWYADADGDGFGDPGTTTTACSQPTGYLADAEDCDDGDAGINPDIDEACNGVDDDCDGTVDEGDAVDADTWYADADGDGWGDAGTTTTACSQPTGYLASTGDCHDGNAAINPDADEECDGVDNDCDGLTDEGDAIDAITWYADADGDGYGDVGSTTAACSQPSGYAASPADCDDGDASAYPGADETCDGADNDCDGTVDEADATDAATWYADADGDGYGDASSTATACSQPTGHVASAGDCDDADASANPDQDELCDGVDNDCDGALDEDDAVDAVTWYADADGDGYGDAGSSTSACSQPSGHVSDSRDCDDGDAGAWPGADEYCNGTDDDCDGTVDERSAVDAATWYRDADGDGYGSASISSVACDQPSGYTADATDCDDALATINPGASEICDSLDNDCDGLVDDADSDTTGQPSWYGDVDGDGYGDASTATLACTQPSGTVTSSTDCDDSDDEVHPYADEWCNGVDDDCDGTVDGSGLATWIEATGTVNDVSATLALGTSSSAYTRHFTTDGTLVLCDGTYYLHVSARTAELTVQGLYGSGSTFVVGDGTAAVVSSNTSASELTLEGLTISGGASSNGGGVDGGSHGLSMVLDDVVIEDCYASSYGGGLFLRAGTLDATELVLDGNTAGDYGGGAYLRSTNATIQDATISDNVAYYAGGLMAHTGDVEVVDSEITDNEAYYYGGGLYVTYGDMLVEETRIHGNAATYGTWTASPAGGGLFLNNGATVECVGSGSTTAGVYDNEADYGAGAFLYDASSTLDSDTCDWGSGSSDNDPDDVALYSSYYAYASFGSDESFTCTGYSCY